MVLVTTLVTPQLLKLRYSKLRSGSMHEATPSDALPPEGGWLRVTRDEVGLAGQPPDQLAVPLALDAAVALARRRPTQDLVDWIADAGTDAVALDERLTAKVLDAVEHGNARSWRFLESSGILARTIPEVATALRRKVDDQYSLDPLQSHRFAALERRRRLDPLDPLAHELDQLEHPDRLLLAAFLIEALESEPSSATRARAALLRLAISPEDREAVVALVEDRDLLWSAALQPGAMSEEQVLQLAAHLDTPEQARTLYLLSALRTEGRERWEVQRLRTLHELIQTVLRDEDLASAEARSLADQHRQAAAALLRGRDRALERLASAPRAYVLRTSAEALARHAVLLGSPGTTPYVEVTADADAGWWVDVATRDEPGLLASITAVLAHHDLAVTDSILAS